MRTFRSVHQYIRSFPSPFQQMLQVMRRTIQATAPEAEEAISYGIPTFELKRNLIHFAGYKHHIRFYPGSAAITALKSRLSTYKSSKEAIQFPIDGSLPLTLVRMMVQFRVASTVPPDPIEKLAVGRK